MTSRLPEPARHGQHSRPEGSEQVAVAVRDDVLRATRRRPSYWVSVHEIARRLALDDHVVERAVDLAIDRGWLVGDGYPPHSVRLAATAMQELS